MNRIQRWAIAPLIAMLALSCSPATLGRSPAQDDDLEELKRRVVELQRQARVAEVELGRLRRQVAELEARLEERAAAAAVAEPPAAAAPRPSPAAPVLEQEVEQANLALDTPAVRATPPESAPPAPAPAAAARPLPPAGQALYDRGYTLYHQGRYVDAETTFQRFIQSYADTELADNAQYWIGEARFARKDIQGALAAFRETVERFPGGNKVPDALLKVGDCLARLGDVDGARALYREVVQRFPATAAAAMAEERVAKLP